MIQVSFTLNSRSPRYINLIKIPMNPQAGSLSSSD